MAEKTVIKLKKFVQETDTHRYVGEFVDPNHVVDNSAFEKAIADLSDRITNSQSWKASVPTFADIAKSYPTPKEGWTVSTDDTNTIYRYDAATSTWVDILKNNNSLATRTSAGLISPELFIKLSDFRPYVHPDKHPADIIEETQEKRFVTQTMVQAWNALVSFPGFAQNTTYTGSATTAARSDHRHETLTGITSISNGSYSINFNKSNFEFCVNQETKLELTPDGIRWKGKSILVEGDFSNSLNDITGIESAWKQLLAKAPSEFVTQHPTWDDVQNKPDTFNPASHTHQISEISNVNSEWKKLLIKAPENYVTQHPTWDEIRNKPETFPSQKQPATTLEPWSRDEQLGAFDGLRIQRFKASESEQSGSTGIVTKLTHKQTQEPTDVNAVAGANFDLNFVVPIDNTTWPKMQVKFTNNHLTGSNASQMTIPFVECATGYVWSGYHDFRSGAGNSGSDMRFKRDIVPMSSMYGFVKNLAIFSYNWIKPNEERFTFGVNSEYLQSSNLPEIKSMVHERADEDKTKWVEYDRFGLIALKVIQELQEKLEMQERRIIELEQKLHP